MVQKHILIVEDNPDIARLIEINLRDQFFSVTCVANGRVALERTREKRFDMIILDIMLPEVSGLDVCKTLRARNDHTPILMLTSKSSELDRVLGLEVGADDYLTKPFSLLELIARIKAIFRRMEVHALQANGPVSDVLRFDDLAIDVDKRMVTIANKSVELTSKEFDLLYYFACHPGRVYERTQLLSQVWGYSHDGYEHTVNSHINRLRSKIEIDPAKPRYVLTVWGVGYKFNDQL